jgi:sugar phosphate isomerase/epimerase
MKPCLAQISSLNSPFAQDVEDYAAGACRAIEVWCTKLEDFLREHSLDDLRRLQDEHEITFPVAAGQGGLLTSQGEARASAWRLFDERLALCRQVGIGTLVIAGDVPQPFGQQELDRLTMSLADAARRGGDQGIRVALEFQADAMFPNNLQSAAALVDEIGHPSLGLCLDAFHFAVGRSKTEDLALLGPHNLIHVQLCDLADRPREFATDADRILPADGDLPLEPLVEALRRINYSGFVSVELMNPVIWRISARQFSEVAMTALRKLLGQANLPYGSEA